MRAWREAGHGIDRAQLVMRGGICVERTQSRTIEQRLE
jgi:hypothetical protein